MARQNFDALDLNIMKMLSSNARKPFLEIARECNVSGAAIHQRIQRLTSQGVIKGYECQIDPTKIGYQTCAYIGFFLSDPSEFEHVIERLRSIPEVVECHYTTGKHDIFAKVHARNNDHLLSIIHQKLLMRGLGRTETLISFKEVFNRHVPVLEDVASPETDFDC